MPGTKEIRSKIASVKSTQKITKAMQMVATSKMRRAQERMKHARPYAEQMRNVLGHLTEANPDYHHPFLVTREPKAVGIIVISTDRGLAGALNANVFRQTLTLMREWQGKGATVSLCLIGSKGMSFFRRLGVPILAAVANLGDRPHVKDLIGTVKVMLDAYRAGQLDRLLLVSAHFVNTMTQQPAVEQLLPIEAIDTEGLQEHWDYIYEPDAAGVLDVLLMRYIESQVYRGAVENVASEMAARMVAMGAASDNAGKLINELQLIYNKARQAAITKELSEIVGGAAAV
ncbi:MAG TPA: F0F1 ATP synthase subunit gamma [Steroidobacteraceae bacterium]|jgi:F-type H+-transporting ATPase subunit gamma|nr:F0F1 ATP synthase subunit gamma [Steroidobacteraceae bacterium]